MTSTEPSRGPIVIGLSTSAPSQGALRWAAEQARSSHRPLHAVHVMPRPATVAAAGLVGAPVMVSDAFLTDLDDRGAVTALWDLVDPEPDWSLSCYHGEPGRTLVEESAGAALLVIGAREHVGWGRVVHGSIGHYCLNHAQCPIAAVPAADAVPSGSAEEAGDLTRA